MVSSMQQRRRLRLQPAAGPWRRWNAEEGRWQSSYASAVDLSEHVWTDFGTSAQGLAGLEPIADYPRAAEIIADALKNPEGHRWIVQRPGSVIPEPTTVSVEKEELKILQTALLGLVADVEAWLT